MLMRAFYARVCYIKSEQRRVPIAQTLKRRTDQGSKRSNKFSLEPPVWFNCITTLHQIIQLLCA